jgi:hypothetical protein
MPSYILAPTFYYTVSYFMTPDRPWTIKDYFHLFWLAIIYLLFTYYLLYESPLRSRVEMEFFETADFISLNILLYLQFFYYCTLSWIKLQKHERNVRLFASTIENVNLKWLKYLVICVLAMALCFITSSAIVSSLNIDNFSRYFYILELPT